LSTPVRALPPPLLHSPVGSGRWVCPRDAVFLPPGGGPDAAVVDLLLRANVAVVDPPAHILAGRRLIGCPMQKVGPRAFGVHMFFIDLCCNRVCAEIGLLGFS